MKNSRQGWKNKYFWYFGKLRIRVNFWLYERTPKIFGRGWETDKYDRPLHRTKHD
jgi:hypothetical protein